MDRRVRVDPRRALLDEIEAEQLTFAPRINRNSQRIVERINAERAARAARASVSEGDLPSASLRGSSSVGGGASGRPPLGRSFLPGHEQETFQPAINPRSHALYRPGIDDKDVYSRLYELGPLARSRAVAQPPSTSSPADDTSRNSPSYFNAVAFEAERHSFILRQLLHGFIA